MNLINITTLIITGVVCAIVGGWAVHYYRVASQDAMTKAGLAQLTSVYVHAQNAQAEKGKYPPILDGLTFARGGFWGTYTFYSSQGETFRACSVQLSTGKTFIINEKKELDEISFNQCLEIIKKHEL